MAHEIDFSTGTASVFTVGQRPWHRLGVNVQEAQTSQEAIRLAGLDWRVNLQSVHTLDRDFISRTIPNTFAVVRQDTDATLGVVSGSYRPFQNEECFQFMDAIVGERLAMFETAGSIRGGRRVWMLARLPQTIRAAASDEILPYVLLSNSHDGSTSLRMVPTTVRVVCANTLNLALNRAGSAGVTIWHTEGLNRRVEDARRNLGIITQRVELFAEQAQAMARRQLTQEQLTNYFTNLVKDRAEKSQKQILESLLGNFENPRNNLPGIQGSIWSALNAVSEWTDHGMRVHGQGVVQLDNRLNSIWFGAADRIKQDAFQAALMMMAS